MAKVGSLEEAQTLITAINARLKAANVPVRVRLSCGSSRLMLRATLPKKSGQGSGKAQYDISLSIPCSGTGLKRIEKEAHILGDRITSGHFDWNDYLEKKKPDEQPISVLVEQFKASYLSSGKIKESTWDETWSYTFSQLPQDELLSEEVILLLVNSTKENSRYRQLTCQRLQKLADFAEVAIDLKGKQGNYRIPEPRAIPSDKEIIAIYDKIPNESWRWVYGMLATFGLRPHEVFLCEFIDEHTIKVVEGKTGSRIVRAIRPEWVELWNLQNVNAPAITGKTHKVLGGRVSRQFGSSPGRYNLPLQPYDLRHAYAIRGSVVSGLPLSTMAAMMGHSAEVHSRTYHRWLSDAVNSEVYRLKILGDSGRF